MKPPINFKNIEYLKLGNTRQKEVYAEIKRLHIFETLSSYHPILTGTIPIGIDLPESDLDIICYCENHSEFSKLLTENYGDQTGFNLYSRTINGVKSTIARFTTSSFEFEIFGQNIPTEEQNAYRHMLVENLILLEKGPEFRSKIIRLKLAGTKTEPAFAELLGLTGDPYQELLTLYQPENE